MASWEQSKPCRLRPCRTLLANLYHLILGRARPCRGLSSSLPAVDWPCCCSCCCCCCHSERARTHWQRRRRRCWLEVCVYFPDASASLLPSPAARRVLATFWLARLESRPALKMIPLPLLPLLLLRCHPLPQHPISPHRHPQRALTAPSAALSWQWLASCSSLWSPCHPSIRCRCSALTRALPLSICLSSFSSVRSLVCFVCSTCGLVLTCLVLRNFLGCREFDLSSWRQRRNPLNLLERGARIFREFLLYQNYIRCILISV